VLAALLLSGLLVAALRGDSYDVVPRSESFIVIWWAAGLAIGFGLLPRQRMSTPARIALASLVGLAAWTALGLLWTESSERTFAEALRVLGYTGLVALVAWSFGARDRPLVVGMIAAVAGSVCVLALISRLAPELLTSATARAGYFRARLAYPFNYWNALGCWAAMTVALGAALSTHASARWARGAALTLATLAPVVVYLTYSRTATVGVGLAFALVVAFSSRRWLAAFNAVVALAGAGVVILAVRTAPEIARGTGTAGRGMVVVAIVLVSGVAMATALVGAQERLMDVRLSRAAARRLLAGVVAVSLVPAVVVGPGLARGAWRSFDRGASAGVSARGDPAARLTTLGGTRHRLWAVALKTFSEHPIEGLGAGTFEFAWNRDPGRAGHVLDAHSVFFESLAELGLPGAMLVLGVLGTLLVAAIRAVARHADGPARGAAAGCAAAFAVFSITATVDWMWESTAIACLGLVVGTLAVARDDVVLRLRRPRWPVRVGLVLVAAAAIVVQLPALVAASQVRASQADVSRGRLVDALDAADSAVRAEPWAASAYLQRALVLESVGDLAAAEDDARHATGVESNNWALWLVLGRIRAERGEISRALVAVGRARELNPREPLFQRGVARELARPGRRVRPRGPR
jgi:hypothetical protein